MAFTASYTYEIHDRYSKVINKISKNTRRFTAATKKARYAVNSMGMRMRKMGDQMTNLQSIIGTAGIIAAYTSFISKSSKAEDMLQDVGRVTNLTSKQLGEFETRLETMSEKLGRSANGLKAIAYEGGKLGIAEDKLESFVLMVTKTSVAFDMAEQEAGRSIGSIRDKLGLTVGGVNELMQRVNFLADNTSASGAKMVNIIERTSGTFGMLKMPKHLIAGWAALSDQVEVTQELAASGLNQMFTRLSLMPGMMTKMMKDPTNAVKDFLGKIAKLDPEKRAQRIKKLFGLEAGRYVTKLVGKLSLLGKTMKIATDTKGLISMDQEFDNVQRRTSTRLERISVAINNVQKAIGDTLKTWIADFSEMFVPVLQNIKKFIKLNPNIIRMITVLAGLLVAFVALVVPIGLIASMVGTMLPLMGLIAGWVGAVLVGVVALVAAFIYWYRTGHPLIQALKDLGVSVMGLFEPFTILFGVLSGGMAMTDLFARVMHAIGSQFMFVVKIAETLILALTGVMQALFSVVPAALKLLKGDFRGAWAELNKGGENAIGKFKQSLSALKDAGRAGMAGFLGLGSQSYDMQTFAPKYAAFHPRKIRFDELWDAQSQAKAGFANPDFSDIVKNKMAITSSQQTEITGKIKVEAGKGTIINEAEIGMPLGENMAYGF